MNCPNCGAALKIKGNKQVCEYCGYERLIDEGQRGDDFYNLVVTNESVGPDDISIKLAESNLGFIIRSGEVVAKDVPPGYHTIVVTSGGMTEYRSICVPGDGRAVKVFVSKGVMGIVIRVTEPGSGIGSYTPGTRSAVPPDKLYPLMALIFSVLIPIVGLVFAMIDITKAKQQNRKASGLTVAALVVVIIRIVFVVVMIAISILMSAMR